MDLTVICIITPVIVVAWFYVIHSFWALSGTKFGFIEWDKIKIIVVPVKYSSSSKDPTCAVEILSLID